MNHSVLVFLCSSWHCFSWDRYSYFEFLLLLRDSYTCVGNSPLGANTSCINNQIYFWKRETVFRESLVQIDKINTYSPLFPFFRGNDDVGQLIWVWDSLMTLALMSLATSSSMTFKWSRANFFLFWQIRG